MSKYTYTKDGVLYSSDDVQKGGTSLVTAAEARAAVSEVETLSGLDMGRQDAVTAVSTANDEITIAGDHTADYSAGDKVYIAGSTGNDGLYTIDTVTLDGSDTDIVLVESITDATVDGNLVLPLDLSAAVMTTGKYLLTLTGNVYAWYIGLAAGGKVEMLVTNGSYTVADLGLTARVAGGLLAIAESLVEFEVVSYDGSTMYALATEVA
jgi:hypothetical protein